MTKVDTGQNVVQSQDLCPTTTQHQTQIGPIFSRGLKQLRQAENIKKTNISTESLSKGRSKGGGGERQAGSYLQHKVKRQLGFPGNAGRSSGSSAAFY